MALDKMGINIDCLIFFALIDRPSLCNVGYAYYETMLLGLQLISVHA